MFLDEALTQKYVFIDKVTIGNSSGYGLLVAHNEPNAYLQVHMTDTTIEYSSVCHLTKVFKGFGSETYLFWSK